MLTPNKSFSFLKDSLPPITQITRAMLLPSRASERLRSAHQPARDDQTLNLLRALVDLRDLCVAHHALDRIVGRVAEATEHLHGVGRHRHRNVTAFEFRHRGPK